MKIKTKLYAGAILSICLISGMAVLLTVISFKVEKEMDNMKLADDLARGMAELSLLTEEYGCNPPCARQQAILMVINESSLAALTG